jgi:plasmid maintenance system antidote protein VapI
MPKLKKTVRDAENERLYGNIRYFMWREDLTVEDLAKKLEVCNRTVQRWMQDVGRLTWGELISLSLVFRCEVSDLTSGELTMDTKKRVIA